MYFLSRDELAKQLDGALTTVRDVAAHLKITDLARPTDNPEWTVHDVFAHLAASGRGLLATAERFLAGRELPADFSLDYWNRRQVQKRREASLDALMGELQEAHNQARAMLSTLSDGQLAMRGTHPAGFEVSVAGILHLMALHELDHIGQVARAVGLLPVPGVSWDDLFRKEQLWAQLTQVRQKVKALVQALTPAEWEVLVTDRWRVRDVIAHLAVAEKGHVQVGWALLRGEPLNVEGFDLDTYNNRAVNERRALPVEAVLAELDEARAETAALLAAVSPEDWEKGGHHPGGFDVTVTGLFRVIAIHEHRHLREVRKALG